MLWTWFRYSNRQEIETYLKGRFAKEPKEVLAFMQEFLSITYSTTVGRGDFERREYDNIAHLVEPAVIWSHLKTIYGSVLDEIKSFPHNITDLDERVAKQFAYVHKMALTEAANQISPSDDSLPAGAS